MIDFKKKHILKIILLSSVLFLNICVQDKAFAAQTGQINAFEIWKKDLKKEALRNGISENFINKMLPKLKFLPKVLESDKKQNEFLLTFWAYTDKVLSEKRIREGKENFKKYAPLLTQTAEKYGIDPKYIMAFWGLETNYGAVKGDIHTLSALATLSFDKRRSAFFTRELITLLKLIEKGETSEFKGSWAGAFGNFQFMPTTYAAYAVDADLDGKRDIINSLPDAFASAANYLSKMGWKSNQLWGREVVLPHNFNWETIPENNKLPVLQWVAKGVAPACGNLFTQQELNEEATLVLPSGIEGPAFLTYRNYDLIMRWNNSSLYALSVGILADKIEKENAPICTPKKEIKISRNDIKFIQSELKKKGYYDSTVDGIIGRNTRKAIRAYQKSVNMPVDSFPSRKLIQKLKGF